jgi:predicted GNAT family acetyltransferase
MRLSPHFENLIESYRAEIDDLRDDSEGKDVLEQRLTDKRQALASLLPMIEMCPEMVAPVFHRAFRFEGRRTDIEGFLSLAEEGAMPWDALAPTLAIAAWAQPLIDTVRAADGGETFLSTAACLEYLLQQAGGGQARAIDDVAGQSVRVDEDRSGDSAAAAADAFGRPRGAAADSDDGDDEARDLHEDTVDDYLEGQGFERRTGE